MYKLEPSVQNLTTKQRQVYDLLVKGLSNEQISEALNKKEKSTKDVLTRIYKKLGVKSRAEAIAVSKVSTVYINSTAVPTEVEIANYVERKLRSSWVKVLKRAGLPADSVVANDMLEVLCAEFNLGGPK